MFVRIEYEIVFSIQLHYLKERTVSFIRDIRDTLCVFVAHIEASLE